MSEPKRYERCYHKDYIPEGMEEHYNGKWVSYADYARLKAEVERLRKAGDGMAKTIGENGVHDNGSFHDVADSIDAWRAAKEGKPSV